MSDNKEKSRPRTISMTDYDWKTIGKISEHYKISISEAIRRCVQDSLFLWQAKTYIPKTSILYDIFLGRLAQEERERIAGNLCESDDEKEIHELNLMYDMRKLFDEITD